jgi:uracil-DNA glycosylase family 4
LTDLNFTEAMKCYPVSRKFVPKCIMNYRDYLIRQIHILQPKVIIALGDKAFKAISDMKYDKFTNVVGRKYTVDFMGIKTILFSIYHPSPASPLCIKANVPLFKEIDRLLNALD